MITKCRAGVCHVLAGLGEALGSGSLSTGGAGKGLRAPEGPPNSLAPSPQLPHTTSGSFPKKLDSGLQGGRGKTVLPLRSLKTTPNKENKKHTIRHKGHANLGLCGDGYESTALPEQTKRTCETPAAKEGPEQRSRGPRMSLHKARPLLVSSQTRTH